MSDNIPEKEAGPPGANTPPSDAPPEKRQREYKEFGHEEEKATRMFFHLISLAPGGEPRC